MADTRELIPVSAEEVEKISGFGRAKEFSVDFPKRAVKSADMRRRRKDFLAGVSAPTGPQPRPKAIKGVMPTGEQLARLRAVHESTAAGAELIAQELDADTTLGLTYSALVSYEYSQMRAEYKRRLANARDRRRVEAQWEKIVEAAHQAMGKAGVKEVDEGALDRLSSELTRSKANFNTVVDIANSARDSKVIPFEGGVASPKGNFLTVYDVFHDNWDVVIPTPPDLCERPIQGKYTKHFSWSFNLSVRITVWCPTWTNPFRTCQKTFTLAGISVALGLEVGYRITCCGAVAWGQAYAQACGTIVGKTVCVGCSARIVGVAGIGKTGSGSTCNYGLGVTAELKCTAAGVTLFQASVPFGWTVTGPCPPPNLPC
jgi:hypothetical protein